MLVRCILNIPVYLMFCLFIVCAQRCGGEIYTRKHVDFFDVLARNAQTDIVPGNLPASPILTETMQNCS